MERRITSVIFEKLSGIIRNDKPIFQMGFEMMQEFSEILALKSIAMIGSEIRSDTTIVLSIPETKKAFFETLISNKEPYNSNLYCEFDFENSLFYCFQLPGFGHIIVEPEEKFHPLFLTELNHIVHFISDYFSAINDRNEKKQLEIELQKEKTLLRTIIDAIPETIAFKDMNETYQLTNRRTNMEYTARFDSIEGKTISDVYPEHERPVVRALDDEVIKTKQIVRREVQMLTDHGYVNYDTIRAPLYDENQEMIGIVSIGRDISEAVHMKETLKRNSAFQELLVKIATNFINIDVKDFDFVINEALEQIGKFIQADRSYVFTYDFEKGITTNTHEWCNEGVSQEIDNLQDLPIEEFVTDWVDIHKQGKEVYIPNVEGLDHDSVLYQILSSQNIRSVISVPFMNEGKPIGFVGFDDVKDDRFWNDYEIGLLKVLAEILTNLFVRRDREEELIQARIQAEKANEAKTNFLANMSHEIRTPLSGIYNSYYLLNTTELNKDQLDYIDIGYSSVDSLNVIVNSILDLSKIEAEKLELFEEPCDLENELYKIIRMQTLSAEEKNINLSYYFDYNINHQVLLDSPKLRQIILNLVNNAIKFTQRGSVQLKVELVEQMKQQYLVRFSVVDTGIGISKNNISQITNKFFQVDSTVSKMYSGTGLGLTIANGLIALFGGKLEISSEENQGSTFSFSIPISYLQGTENKYSLIQNKKILLITDDESPCLINRIFTSMSANTTQIYPEYINNLYLSKTKYDIIVINSRCEIDFQAEIGKIKQSVSSKQPIFMLCCSNFSAEERSKFESYGFNIFIDQNTSRDYIYHQITTFLDQIYHEVDKKLLAISNHFTTLHQQKILIVDDNKLNRKALEIILTKHGFIVDEAENGLIAINKVEENDYSLILMDIQMPGMSGIEATQRIRQMEKKKNVPIIAVTAHAFRSDYITFKNHGMDDVITKPIKIDLLMDMLMKYLHKEEAFLNYKHDVIIPSDLASFDETDFLFRFEEYSDLAIEVIHSFLQDYRKDLKEIESAVNAQSTKQIESTAHYFKGSAEYLSAKRVVWLLKKMIEDARNDDSSYALTYYTKIESEIDELVKQLHRFLNERKNL